MRRYWPAGLVFLLVLIFYHPVLGTYFAGDDFFHFKVALRQTKLGLIGHLGFYSYGERGIAFYRPIFREVLYDVFYRSFGLNPLPFRLLQMGMHLVNIYLVYRVLKYVFRKDEPAWLGAAFFGLTAANVGVLYYLAGGIQAQGATFFSLLAMILFLNKRWKLTFGSFVLALGSHEMAAALPFLLGGLIVINNKKFKYKDYLVLIPYFLALVVYLFLNLSVIGFSGNEVQYRAVFSLSKTLNTLAWYLAWSLGLPEMTVDFVGSGLRLDPRLLRFWGDYYRVIFPVFFGLLLVIGGCFVLLLFKNREKIFNRRLIFLGMWFLGAILPVLLLPLHKKTYYLALALPAFWGGVVWVVYYAKAKLTYLLVAGVLVLNFSAVKLGEKTYWAINRGRVAKRLVEQIKLEYPELAKGAVVYVKNDPDYEIFSEEWGGTSRQAFYALNGSDAFQLLYKDFDLRVYYEDVDGQMEGRDLRTITAVATD